MSHNLLHDSLLRFRAKYSYETTLNHILHKWIQTIDKGLLNGVVPLSNPSDVITGVPRGFILGPLSKSV